MSTSRKLHVAAARAKTRNQPDLRAELRSLMGALEKVSATMERNRKQHKLIVQRLAKLHKGFAPKLKRTPKPKWK